MQERPAQGVPPNALPDRTASKPLGDSFLAGKRYPGEAPPPTPAPPTPGPSSGRVFTRVVLPLLIFVGAIGVLAWVTQYLPSRGTPPETGPNPGSPTPPLVLTFTNPAMSGLVVADWEPERTRAEWAKLKAQAKQQGKNPAEVPAPPPSAYAAEYEVTTDEHEDGGHYDFPFENRNREPVAVGLESKNCQCASIAACALTSAEWARYQKLAARADPIARSRQSAEDGLPWKILEEGNPDGLVVAAGQHGVIRFFWKGRSRREPARPHLFAAVAMGQPGKLPGRHALKLGVPVAYVRPAAFDPDRLNLGSVSPQNPSVSDALYCWSATRDLKVEAHNADPCFEVQAKKLEKAEDLRKLTDDLPRRSIPVWTRVRSAYRIEVTVYEQKDGRHFDLGTFLRTPNVEVWGNGERLHPSVPAVRGRVRGDIKVGTFEDDGAITVQARTDRLTRVTGKIWTPPGVKLEYEGFTPRVLNLEKNVEVTDQLPANSPDRVSGWTAWQIRMTVPPGLEPGPLPEDSAILLRVTGTNPPRRIRIPLIGSASRG